jgi:hypothetical protein
VLCVFGPARGPTRPGPALAPHTPMCPLPLSFCFSRSNSLSLSSTSLPPPCPRRDPVDGYRLLLDPKVSSPPLSSLPPSPFHLPVSTAPYPSRRGSLSLVARPPAPPTARRPAPALAAARPPATALAIARPCPTAPAHAPRGARPPPLPHSARPPARRAAPDPRPAPGAAPAARPA